MRFVRRAPLWLSAVLALIAIGLLCAFMLDEKAQYDALLDATIASVLAAASLFTGVCLVSFEVRREFASAGQDAPRRLFGRMLRRRQDQGHQPERRSTC